MMLNPYYKRWWTSLPPTYTKWWLVGLPGHLFFWNKTTNLQHVAPTCTKNYCRLGFTRHIVIAPGHRFIKIPFPFLPEYHIFQDHIFHFHFSISVKHGPAIYTHWNRFPPGKKGDDSLLFGALCILSWAKLLVSGKVPFFGWENPLGTL